MKYQPKDNTALSMKGIIKLDQDTYPRMRNKNHIYLNYHKDLKNIDYLDGLWY